MKKLSLLAPLFLLPAFRVEGQDPKAEEPFRWNLQKGQVLDVRLSVRHQGKTIFTILSVSGTLTLDSVSRDGEASGIWKIQSLSNHHRFVEEQKVSYSDGRWTQVVHTSHVFRDANDKAQTETKKNLEFMDKGKKWADNGATVPVKLGPGGLSVEDNECPIYFDPYLAACWPQLKLPAVQATPEKIDLVPTRTGQMFASLKIDKSSLVGRWTAVGANPAYLEDGTAVARWKGISGQSVVEQLKYSRTTSASAAIGCVSKVSETFSVTSTVDGKPYESNTGSFSLVLAPKK